jgi:hypothetical protein
MIIILPGLIARAKICEIHSSFWPEDMKGRNHLTKKRLDKRIQEK